MMCNFVLIAKNMIVNELLNFVIFFHIVTIVRVNICGALLIVGVVFDAISIWRFSC